MEKHLLVNTGVMDMVSTKLDAIQAYDYIRINCAFCLTTAKTRHLLSQGKIVINTSSVYDVGNDDNVEIVTVNGLKKIDAEFEASGKTTVLVVNGTLIIEDSSKRKLDQYKNVIIYGVALHPKSFDTSNFLVNGALIPYPDGATLILQELELTDTFIRASTPGTTYYVHGIPSNINEFVHDPEQGMSDVVKKTGLRATEKLDLALLKSKNIRFYTGWVTTLEENAEQLMRLVDGYIGSTIIPTGYKIMKSGRLNKMAVHRFGKRIYVEGNLEIHYEDADALISLEQLIVTGEVILAESVVEIFFEKCIKYNGLSEYKGEWLTISDTEFSINKEFLEGLENGGTFNITSSDVQINKDVSAELLSNKIHEIFLNESTLTISLNQQNALRKLIRNNDGNVCIREYECSKQPEPVPVKHDLSETRINCKYYKL